MYSTQYFHNRPEAEQNNWNFEMYIFSPAKFTSTCFYILQQRSSVKKHENVKKIPTKKQRQTKNSSKTDFKSSKHLF